VKHSKERLDVSADIHDSIIKAYEKFRKNNEVRARCYILGSDKNNVVREIVRLRTEGGCHNMPAVSASEVAKGFRKVLDKNLIMAGMLRLGNLDVSSSYIWEICHLSSKAVMLSFGRGRVRAVRKEKGKEARNLEYNIVP